MAIAAPYFISLAFGMIVQGNFQVVANNSLYVFFTMIAFLTARWNLYSIDTILRKFAEVDEPRVESRLTMQEREEGERVVKIREEKRG